jgi:hypothetical protein
MNKQTLIQSKLDAARLESAADRIRDLRDAYLNTKDDLRIAQQGLKTIHIWAKFQESHKSIEDRAMDTLSLISEANRG